MSKQLGSSQPERQRSGKQQPIAIELMAELVRLANTPDSKIDLSEMPEQLDWTRAAVGKYYRPIKEQLSIRLDADVVGWFKARGKGYQSRINEALRNYVFACSALAQKQGSRTRARSGSAEPVGSPKRKMAKAKRKNSKKNSSARG